MSESEREEERERERERMCVFVHVVCVSKVNVGWCMKTKAKLL